LPPLPSRPSDDADPIRIYVALLRIRPDPTQRAFYVLDLHRERVLNSASGVLLAD
jgi:hypothetical protein